MVDSILHLFVARSINAVLQVLWEEVTGFPSYLKARGEKADINLANNTDHSHRGIIIL